MRCSKCNAYIPDGLSLSKCLECGAEILVGEMSKEPLDIESEKSSINETIAPPPTTAKKSYKKQLIGTLVFLSIIAVPFFLRDILFSTNHSYYIDGDIPQGRGVPNNRTYIKDGGFYRLVINYPQDLFSMVGGMEVFLLPGGSTHFASIVGVSKSDIPVRFQIKKFEMLTPDNKAINPVNYQGKLTPDLIRKQGIIKDKKKALIETAKLIPQMDFTYTSNLDNVYYGYELKRPPENLTLSFDVDIYTLDRTQRDEVTETIQLKRVNGDPKAWLRK